LVTSRPGAVSSRTTIGEFAAHRYLAGRSVFNFDVLRKSLGHLTVSPLRAPAFIVVMVPSSGRAPIFFFPPAQMLESKGDSERKLLLHGEAHLQPVRNRPKIETFLIHFDRSFPPNLCTLSDPVLNAVGLGPFQGMFHGKDLLLLRKSDLRRVG
jgi:hypothetical protein